MDDALKDFFVLKQQFFVCVIENGAGLVASVVRQKCKTGHLAGGWRPLWLLDGGRFGWWMEAALAAGCRPLWLLDGGHFGCWMQAALAGGLRPLWLLDAGRFEDVHQRGNEERHRCS